MTTTKPRPLDTSKLTSTFAILDVKGGRHALAKHFKDRPRTGPCPAELRVPVTIHGTIDGVWGHDDGVSIEFSVDVTKLEFANSRNRELPAFTLRRRATAMIELLRGAVEAKAADGSTFIAHTEMSPAADMIEDLLNEREECSRGWRDAFDVMHQRAMRAEEALRQVKVSVDVEKAREIAVEALGNDGPRTEATA
jgi:hypothetical protein